MNDFNNKSFIDLHLILLSLNVKIHILSDVVYSLKNPLHTKEQLINME